MLYDTENVFAKILRKRSVQVIWPKRPKHPILVAPEDFE